MALTQLRGSGPEGRLGPPVGTHWPDRIRRTVVDPAATPKTGRGLRSGLWSLPKSGDRGGGEGGKILVWVTGDETVCLFICSSVYHLLPLFSLSFVCSLVCYSVICSFICGLVARIIEEEKMFCSWGMEYLPICCLIYLFCLFTRLSIIYLLIYSVKYGREVWRRKRRKRSNLSFYLLVDGELSYLFRYLFILASGFVFYLLFLYTPGIRYTRGLRSSKCSHNVSSHTSNPSSH